jgi:hypothetical protein
MVSLKKRIMLFETFPEEIFQIIGNYTNINNLLNSTAKLNNVKKKLFYWKLNRQFSIKYYQNEIFREELLVKMNDINKQLSLILAYYHKDIDVSILANIHTLDLSNCNIKDVSLLKNAYKLKLSCCQKIEDISALEKVQIIDLAYCYKITDVSPLKNAYMINLYGCYNVIDVSALEKVQILDLSYCKKVKDISMLKNVPKLKLFCIN